MGQPGQHMVLLAMMVSSVPEAMQVMLAKIPTTATMDTLAPCTGTMA